MANEDGKNEELSQEDVFNNDIDPLEGIRQLRKEDESNEQPEDDSADADLDNDDVNVDDSEEDSDSVQASDDETSETDEDSQEDADNDTDDESEDLDAEDVAKAIRKFKAQGQEFEFTDEEIMEQFPTVFGQAMDYTKKMQAIKPYRKMISALEEEGISQDQLNIAIDALKGNKGALQALAKANDIDVFDLSPEEEAEYSPNVYGKDEAALDVDSVIKEISNDQEFAITADVVDNQWDEKSREKFANNPQLIQGLHNDIKSGLFDKIAPAAMKMKVLDGNTRSDIEYYMLAGQTQAQSNQSSEGQDTVDKLNGRTQAAVNNADQASSEAQRKRAAAPAKARADRKKAVDYLNDDNDEAYESWYKNLMSKN